MSRSMLARTVLLAILMLSTMPMLSACKELVALNRLRLMSAESDFDSDYVMGKSKEMAGTCARYDVVFEDRGSPLHPGTALPKRAAGLMCIPLAADQMVHIVYDERRLPDEKLLTTFDAEARQFFDSLQFAGDYAGPS